MASQALWESRWHHAGSRRTAWRFWCELIRNQWARLLGYRKNTVLEDAVKHVSEIVARTHDLRDIVKKRNGLIYVAGTVDQPPLIAETLLLLEGAHVMRVHAPAGFRMRDHVHDQHELFYVESGRMEVAAVDGRNEVLGPGDCMYIAPGQGHQVHWQTESKVLTVTVPRTPEYG